MCGPCVDNKRGSPTPTRRGFPGPLYEQPVRNRLISLDFYLWYNGSKRKAMREAL